MNDTATAASSCFEGLSLENRQIIVEIIITPPVTMGY